MGTNRTKKWIYFEKWFKTLKKNLAFPFSNACVKYKVSAIALSNTWKLESCICIQVSNNKCPKVMEEILNIPNLLHICNLLRNVTKNNKIHIIRADMALIYFTRRHSHASSNAKVCNFFANEAIWAALHINHCKTFVWVAAWQKEVGHLSAKIFLKYLSYTLSAAPFISNCGSP